VGDRVLVTGHALSDLDRMPDREAVAGLLRRVRGLGAGSAGRLAGPVARLETGDVLEVGHAGVRAFVLRKEGREGAGGAAGRPVFYVMKVEKSEEAEERARKIRELMGMAVPGEG